MANHERRGYAVAIAGGLGLGLLLGSEFPGSVATMLGAALTISALIGLAILAFRPTET